MEHTSYIGYRKHGIMKWACMVLVMLASAASLAGEPLSSSSFTIPQGAYSAEFVEDINQISVIRFAGNYDKKLPGGELNAAARAVVAKEFYKHHADNYDFLVVFTAFEFKTNDAKAFNVPVKNDTQGLGQPLFDNSTLYGSNSKLQGYIDMAAI